MKITFTKSGETKGTFKYSEDKEPNKIGTLYLKKDAANELGNPDKVELTVVAK